MATRPSLKEKAGDALRDAAAKILASQFGAPKIEKRIDGKKVDVYFEHYEFGRKVRLYVEAKDYDRQLHRSDVVNIFSDYSGLLDRYKPASLLIVTRNGLSTDADKYVNEEQAYLRHQSIQEIEIASVDLDAYLESLIEDYGQSFFSLLKMRSQLTLKTLEDCLAAYGALTPQPFHTIICEW